MRILIGGGGQVGELIAKRLIREGNELVVVEQSPERCRYLEDQLDAKIVQGSIARVETLRRAGLASAEMLLAITTSDDANLLACMIAQAESGIRVKVARLRTHEFAHWRRVTEQIGLKIDLIIHPESELSERIMRVVRVPGLSDIIDFFDGRAKLFGMSVDVNSWFAGKTLAELDYAGPPRNSLITMIFRDQQVIVPHGAEVLKPGDHIYCITTNDEFNDVLRFMGLKPQEALNSAFIVGGKQVGICVAELLEAQGVAVKLFERDEERCNKIASILKKTIVIRGDGTDQATLREAKIEEADAFLAFTNDDADNILASLLVRKLGVKKVVALVNRLYYLPMVQRLGISTTISPRVAVADRILQFVRKGRVVSVTTFREEEAEAIELMATRNSKYLGKQLRDVRLPRGAIVGAIARPDGTVIVPRGGEAIREGDLVIFFALERVIPQLEASF